MNTNWFYHADEMVSVKVMREVFELFDSLIQMIMYYILNDKSYWKCVRR